jgi:hypothetical protein
VVGLDEHAAKVLATILDAETGELRFQRLGGESEPRVRLVSSPEGPVTASYGVVASAAAASAARKLTPTLRGRGCRHTQPLSPDA